MEQNLNYIPINTAIRPAKLVVLVDINSRYWETDCLSILAMFNKIWGGDYNLIIPTDGYEIHPYFLQILKVYDPDYIEYHNGKVIQLKKFDSKQFDEYINQSKENSSSNDHELFGDKKLAEDEHFLNTEFGELKISDKLKKLLQQETNTFNDNSSWELLPFTYDNKVSYPLTDMGEILKYSGISNVKAVRYSNNNNTLLTRLLLHSNVGIVDSYLEKSLEKENIRIDYEDVRTDNKVFKFLDSIYERDNYFDKKNYAFSVSSVNIDYYIKEPDIESSSAFIIMGNTLSDFCLYYCLSKLKKSVYWFPNDFEFSNKLSNIVNNKRQSHRRRHGDKLVLISMSLGDVEIKDIMDSMEDKQNSIAKMIPYVIEENINQLLKNNLIAYCTENHTNEQVLIFDTKTRQSIYPIDTPVPLYFSKVLPYGHFWITDISVKDTIFPKNQNLSKCLLSAKSYGSNQIRITNEGISYLSPNIVYFNQWGDNIKSLKINPYLKLPGTIHLLKELFQASGYFVKTSDKGKYAQAFIDRFNGIENLTKVLLTSGYKKVLDKFIDTSKNEKGVYNKGIYLNKRRYLDYEAIESIVGERNTASSIVNDYLKKDVIERGFIFKCQECRNADWHSISDVGNTFRCPRCYKDQTYTTEALQLQPDINRVQPIWYYKLNEMIYQAYLHNSIVPILTLATLKKLAKTSFDYAPEVEIREQENSPKPNLEIDICCVVDGEVIIGECKKGSDLKSKGDTDEKVIQKYLKLAEKIQAHIVVFSTLDNWSRSTLEVLKRYQNSTTHVKILIFQKEELIK